MIVRGAGPVRLERELAGERLRAAAGMRRCRLRAGGDSPKKGMRAPVSYRFSPCAQPQRTCRSLGGMAAELLEYEGRDAS
jgi:hypothetical protein